MNSLLPARFGLRAKLLTGAAVLLAFTAVIGVLGLRALDQANRAGAMYDVSVEPLAELGTARAKFNENRAFTNNHILETSAADKAELETKIDANNAIVDKNLVAVEDRWPPTRASACSRPQAPPEGLPRGPQRGDRALRRRQAREAYALNKRRSSRPRPRPRSFLRPLRLQGQPRRRRERGHRGRRGLQPQALAAPAGRRAHRRLRDGVLVRAPHPADGHADPRPDPDAARPRHDRSRNALDAVATGT